MKYLFTLLFVLFALIGFQPDVSAKLVPQFKNGDRVCFIGDSITHGGSYHANVSVLFDAFPGS